MNRLLTNGGTLFVAIIKGALDFNHHDLISFDIFDTLFYRRCGGFFKVFERLEEQSGIDGLAQLRKSTEVQLLHQLQREISFDEIYAALNQLKPEHDWETIKKRELELEEENIVVSNRAWQALQKARSRGATIIFLSDMYMNKKWIQEQLQSHSIWKEGDLLFVSSEAGSNKRSGKLFETVRKDFPGLKWKHSGDNLLSDVLSAYRLGITSIWLPHSYLRSIHDQLYPSCGIL